MAARSKIERGRRGKRRNPSANIMNTLALHSIHRWRTKAQPFAVKRKEVACGSRDIRDIVSACTVWFTFLFRTPTPRAVEDFIVKVLLASRGARHSASALLPSFTSLLYHKDGDLSRGFSKYFEKSFRLPKPLRDNLMYRWLHS